MAFLKQGGIFLKVDTEGFDVHVLAGANCALRSGAIDVIQIEWNRRKLPTAAPQCVSLQRVANTLEDLGYEAFLAGPVSSSTRASLASKFLRTATTSPVQNDFPFCSQGKASL